MNKKKLMTMVIALTVSLSAMAQALQLKLNNVTVKKAMTELKAKSGYSFVYEKNDVNTSQTINVDATTLDQAITQILAGQDVKYEINGKNIIIAKPKVTSPLPIEGNKQRIHGTVMDANEEPIIGATIQEKGTKNATVSDVDGNFSLEVSPNAVLEISYIGYKTLSFPATNKNMVISLDEDNNLLDDVIVVGYGIQRKSDLTGSVARVNMEAVKNAPNVSITSSLQGAVPGLNVGQVNSAGGSANIEIRGRSTLSGNTNVLIVLDGIVYNGSMASINPADIESIDVLKDASSKAIYGASAANGVILITTKKGKMQGKPTINFNMTLSSQSPAKQLHPFNREEKIRSIFDYYWNQGGYTQGTNGEYVRNSTFDVGSKIEATQVEGYGNGLDYNWLNEGTQDSYYMNYQVSLTQATERTSYYISGGYTKQEGWVKNDSFDRKNARINIESKVFDWLKVGTQSFGSFMNYSGVAPDLNSLYLYSPLNSPYDENGELVYIPNGTLTNPFVAFEAKDKDYQNTISALAYAIVDIPFVKGLSYRINWGNNYKWNQHYYDSVWGSNHKGSAYKNNSSAYDYTLDHILSYKQVFADKHHLDITAVFGMRTQKYEYTTANGEQYNDLTLGFNSLELASIQKIGSDAWKEQYLYQMGRVNYNYDDRYLMTVTLRRDGFSGFSENHKYGLFPSFAFGWVLSNEKFFKVDAISNLKLRISYGANGNLTSRYSTMARMGSSNYVFGDGGMTAYAQYVSSMASDLKWESTQGMNYGVDISFLKGRVNLSVDYYNMSTKNLLWNVNIPTITGFSSIATNIGKINNKGIEIALNADVVHSKDWNWNVGVNFSKNKNKIDKLLGDLDGDGMEDDLVSSGLFVGESINAIYDYNIIGLWGTEDEKAGLIPSGTYVGCEKIEDLNNDGKIDAANDRKILGTKDPSFRWSLSSILKYKEWTLSALVNSVVGGSKSYLGANNALANLGNNSGDNFIKHNMFSEIDYWRPDNQDADYRIPVRVPSVQPSYWKNRTFVRLQDVSLTYNFNHSFLKHLGLQDLSLSLVGKNLLTITGWKGWDPETGDGMVNAYPVMKSYSLGLNITF